MYAEVTLYFTYTILKIGHNLFTQFFFLVLDFMPFHTTTLHRLFSKAELCWFILGLHGTLFHTISVMNLFGTKAVVFFGC